MLGKSVKGVPAHSMGLNWVIFKISSNTNFPMAVILACDKADSPSMLPAALFLYSLFTIFNLYHLSTVHSKLLQPVTHIPLQWGQSFGSTHTFISAYFIVMLSVVKLSLKKYGNKYGWNTAFLIKFTAYFLLLQKLRQTSDKTQHWNMISFL